jgi:hypothetical protein
MEPSSAQWILFLFVCSPLTVLECVWVPFFQDDCVRSPSEKSRSVTTLRGPLQGSPASGAAKFLLPGLQCRGAVFTAAAALYLPVPGFSSLNITSRNISYASSVTKEVIWEFFSISVERPSVIYHYFAVYKILYIKTNDSSDLQF